MNELAGILLSGLSLVLVFGIGVMVLLKREARSERADGLVKALAYANAQLSRSKIDSERTLREATVCNEPAMQGMLLRRLESNLQIERAVMKDIKSFIDDMLTFQSAHSVDLGIAKALSSFRFEEARIKRCEAIVVKLHDRRSSMPSVLVYRLATWQKNQGLCC